MQENATPGRDDFSVALTEELLPKVVRPGQYLGNEWGARRKPFDHADVRLALAFPDLYELGMSNFGLKILYQIVNNQPHLLADRAYAPGSDMEELVRERKLPLWGWESRRALNEFELIGFSLQYELTYTNVLNMLQLAQIPVRSEEREQIFPLIFGGGPSSVNPEPMALFMDFFIIGDGESAVPAVMNVIAAFKKEGHSESEAAREELLLRIAQVEGVYVPAFYELTESSPVVKVREKYKERSLPERVLRQISPLTDENQPTNTLVPYLSLVHDREVLEVRRGCDRGCRFCQPGYTFLPVRERSTEDLLKLSTEALRKSGHQEYSMLSLCVSDYTTLHESVRALNEEHMARRSSLSFPSQRADRMNLDLAEELKAVRKSGITLAPEAGTERLRMVINKGLSHQQIISAIEAAYQSGWASVKLYFMCGLPTERDEDLDGIIEMLREATQHCRAIRRADPLNHKRDIEFTCTISNFVPKPFTPFQWFAQITPEETERRHKVLRAKLRELRLRNVQLNTTGPQISLLESVISRGDRRVAEMIFDAWQHGAVFDAWDERLKPQLWHDAAERQGTTLEAMACTAREVGSRQPWDIVNIGLADWWLVKEWEKAMQTLETPPCTENLCHACGVCTELETTHLLAKPKPEVMKRNPFVKELSANKKDEDSHPSLFFMEPGKAPADDTLTTLRFEFTKIDDLRFISHLDLQSLLVRAARRAGLSLAYTKGFNPQPKLKLAQPLPLFQETLADVAEVELAQTITADDFKSRMNSQLPPELRIGHVKQLSEKTSQSLASALGRAQYKAVLSNFPDAAAEQKEQLLAELTQSINKVIQEILARPSIEVPQGQPPRNAGFQPASMQSQHEVLPTDRAQTPSEPEKVRDIKPGVFTLRKLEDAPLTLILEIAHGSKMHVKPTELLALLKPRQDFPEIDWRLTRLQLSSETGVPLYDL